MNQKNNQDEVIEQMLSANAFVRMLAQLNDGTLPRASEAMGEAIAAVKRTGQKAKLTVSLAVIPDDKGEVRTVDIVAEVATKLPARKRRATTFFVVGEQSLSRQGVGEQPEFDFEARQAAGSVTRLPGVKQA